MPSLSSVFDPKVGPLLRIAMAPPGWKDGGHLVVIDALVDTCFDDVHRAHGGSVARLADLWHAFDRFGHAFGGCDASLHL
jgi:hypothetical protein